MKPLPRNLCIFVTTLALLGCASDDSADQRLARILSINTSVKLTEELVTKRVRELFPLGTAEADIEASALRIGFKAGNLCSYIRIPNQLASVLRCEFDVRTFAVTKAQWIISLSLSGDRKLQHVDVKRYVVGL